MTLRPWISSPLPDSTAAVLGLLGLGVLLETPRLARAGLVWVALLAATAVTAKSVAGALLLGPLAAALWQPARRRWAQVGLVASVALVVLLPWLGRNVGLSGYLVYPLTGPLVRAWAVPPAQLVADVAEMRLFARRPLGDWPLAAGQPLRQWLPPWWAQQALADQLLVKLLVAGIGLVLSWLIGQLLLRKTTFGALLRRPDVQLYGLLLLSAGACLAVAPALRYAYAYLIGAAVLAPLLVVRRLPARWGRVAGWLLGGLTLAYTLNGLRHELVKPGALTTYLLQPADYAPVRTRVAGQLGPYSVQTGAWPNSRCGNSLLPCTDSLAPDLRLRGATLRQGFRRVAAPD